MPTFHTVLGKGNSLWKIMEVRNKYGLFQEGQAYITAGYNTGYWLGTDARWDWNDRQSLCAMLSSLGFNL